MIISAAVAADTCGSTPISIIRGPCVQPVISRAVGDMCQQQHMLSRPHCKRQSLYHQLASTTPILACTGRDANLNYTALVARQLLSSAPNTLIIPPPIPNNPANTPANYSQNTGPFESTERVYLTRRTPKGTQPCSACPIVYPRVRTDSAPRLSVCVALGGVF